MTTIPPPPEGAEPTAPWKPLEATQRRVLGVLVEKAKTTPAGYPMTLNAIVAGCNQKSNRDPVTALEDGEVERALDQLTTFGVASEAPIVSRVPKYRHHAYQWFGVNRAELAVLAELLLRGEQTIGDLRARAARMEPIADQAALRPLVEGLIARGLAIELTPPGRGQVVSHGVYLAPELEVLKARYAGQTSRMASLDDETPHARRAAAAPEFSGAADRVAALTAEVAELRHELDRLHERVRALEARPEPPAG